MASSKSVLTVVLHKLGFLAFYIDNTTTKFLSSLCKIGQLYKLLWKINQDKKNKQKNLHDELYTHLNNSQYLD